jgi:2,4-dienoyl-CoA reductase-like NADH-dependent reductase (Old Yellow Enzyme family)
MTAAAEPLALGRAQLRNRIVATAHATAIVDEGRPAPGDAEYWRRLAAGGAAMAITGGTVVDTVPGVRAGNLTRAHDPAAIPGMQARAEAIKSEGAIAVCQLAHLGRETLGVPWWTAPVAPSPVRSSREPAAPRALSEAEVSEVVVAFRDSAANALEAGYDGIELHAAHAYLLAQFLSPEVNRRRDRYGNGPAGRARVVTEIVREIREIRPEAIIGVRLSDQGPGSGLELEEIRQLLPRLVAASPFDYLNLTVGERGEYVRDMATEDPPLVGRIAELRAVTPGALLVSQGFRDRDAVEAALAEGADLVGMARGLIADPDLPRKLLRGREREIRPCVACNQDCRLFDPSLLCSVNPDLAPPGHRRRPASPPLLVGGRGCGRRVAILGAGPAGLECAITLASSTADVTLVDQRSQIGGELATAAEAPNRRAWRRLIDFYAFALDGRPVLVELGRPAEARSLAGFEEIVLALGSTEIPPEIPGIEAALTTGEALRHGPDALAGVARLIVIDDGFGWWPALNAVELGVAAGVERIVFVSPSGNLGAGIPPESRTQLLRRLAGAKLDTRGLLEPIALDAGELSLRHRLSGEIETLMADAVIVAGERRARELGFELPDDARVQAVGDCVVPRRVSEAIAEGRAAAELITGRANGGPSLGRRPTATAGVAA